MEKKALTTLTILMSVCSISFADLKSTEVEGSGVGYGESKSHACEVALNNARTEAAQSAYTLIHSTFESMESSRGVKYQQDDRITSKAYARLLNKKESTEYMPDSGQIRCVVGATFKASPVALENYGESLGQPSATTSNSSSRSEQVRQRTIEVVAGQPFCLKYFGNNCFREYFDPKIKKWGIQSVGNGISAKGGSSISSGELTLMTIIDGIQIDTKEAFIEWYDNALDNLPSRMILIGKGEGYKFSKNGYEKSPSDFYIQGLPKEHVGFFTSDSDFDSKKIKQVNNRLVQGLMKE